MKSLGGYICVRNGNIFDYCWREAVLSLLPVVDELILCDSDSTDGTRADMEGFRSLDHRIKVINMPWTDPKGQGPRAWIEWLNFARIHLSSELQITLDADEILNDSIGCHQAIFKARETGDPKTFNRLNFWRDPRSLIPDGHCCGRWVTRFGPERYVMCSDEPHEPGEYPLTDYAVKEPDVEIFHMGFLRRKEAFYAKSKAVQRIWNDSYDSRLQVAEAEGKPVWESECSFADKLEPYDGGYPEIIIPWLKERGFQI